MPNWAQLSTVRLVAVALTVSCALASVAKAQDATLRIRRIAPYDAGRPGGTGLRLRSSPTPRMTYRGLTVNRQPEAGPGDLEDRDTTLVDGPIRYGDIHGFNPLPTVSSGQQFPYGLDGIGGNGSDLGISAGQNASIYVRGP